MVSRPTYRQASFKGVPFEVTDSSADIGRRGALHEYVNEDLPYFEDMGRKARRYEVSAYFRGDDHLLQAGRLQRAIERRGAGQLVLPNRETDNVYCIEARRSESLKDTGRETTFDMSFVEAGEFRFPSGFLDTILELVTSATGAVEGIVSQVSEVTSSVGAAVSAVETAASSVAVSLTGLSFDGLEFSDFPNFFQQIGQASNPVAAGTALAGLSSFQSAVAPNHNGPNAQATYQNDLVFDRAFRTAAAVEAARVAQNITFTNRRDAIRYRDRVLTALETDYADLDGDVVGLVADVRSKFMQDISSRLVTLPTFIRIDLGTSFPSVVAANEALGDFTREADLRTWNATLHPLFMPSAVDVLR